MLQIIKELGAHDVHFVGHELNSNTKMLLKSDRMDYVIGHDVKYELKNLLNYRKLF